MHITPTRIDREPARPSATSFALRFVVPSLVFGAVIACSKEEVKAPPPPKLDVSVVAMSPQDVPVHYEFIGQTAGSVDAEVRARVDGVILSMNFEEGKEVKEGQVLYKLDPAPFMATVAEAKGKLAEAQTRLAKAQSDLQRIRPLAKINAVSQRDLDSAIAQEGVARGGVDAAKAGVEAAEIKLGYAEIKAPVSGVIGLTKAKVGELVGVPPNPVILNTVSQLDPINVRFTVNEREYLYFARQKQQRDANGEATEPRELTLVLSDGSEHTQKGTLASVDQRIDPSTGSIALEASFPNPQKVLRPGLFAKIRTVGEVRKGALTVPNVAVKELQGQYSVFVVSPEGKVEERTIKVGPEFENGKVVDDGLKAGELVAVDNLQRLRPGLEVNVKK